MNRHSSMNRIYRLVWSAVRSVWIPVAETARGRGKRSSPRLVAAALSLTCAIAQASPSGGQVVAGSGSITQSGATTTITQATQNLSLTWASFNIAPQQSVNFVQPSTSSIAVNRILGTNGTQILGYLHTNGQVFLINPNGIVFGPSAEVNVGGLVASTLELDEAGTAGNSKSFSGTGTGSVLNQGTITASEGGYVVLVGNHVSNEGVISAELGTVALGAGSAVTLTFAGNSRVRMQVDQSMLNSLAQNGGLIRADGGQVIMNAGARDALMASVVNNTGVIEARTVDTHDGTITLLGGMTAGTVEVGGTLDASAPESGTGGLIDTSAAHVEVAAGARVTTAARDGLYGSWLIDPQDFTVAASGGDITGAALSSELATTGIVLQSSAGAASGSGNVNVNDPVTWNANTTLTLSASNNVNVNANITASGNTAGLVINPNTANGSGSSAETATGSGTFNLTGASITLSGATPYLSIAGTTYTVINTLGAPGSMTATDLQGMNGNLAASYALGSDIDASATSAWNSNAGFTPIGTSGAPFGGTFDGLGHTITNLTINLPNANYVGLFGNIGSGSIVQNVGLVGGSVSGGILVGELVGYNTHGTINNSYTTGNVTGTSNVGGLVGFNEGSINNSYAAGTVSGANSFIGGLVGDNSYGDINNSYATGSVSGTNDNIGGLVGADFGASISNSYATGSASSTALGINIGGLAGTSFGGSISNSHASGSVSGNQAGGLVGTLEGNGTVANSYATGSVSGGEFVGGLVGVLSFGAISDAYATGSVSAAGGYVGGLLGYGENGAISDAYATGSVSGGRYVGGLVGFNVAATFSTSYWNTNTNPGIPGVSSGPSAGATGLTTLQMQTAANFTGFVFTATPGAAGNNWVMVDTDGTLNNVGGALAGTFPMLSSEYSTAISNAHQLQLIAMALGASYTLAANIDAAGTDTSTTLGDVWSTSGGFVPIGSNNANFTGSFNGLGHTISNLTINLPTAAGVGLFGYTSANSAIQNVGLVEGSVAGGSNTGDLVGVLGGMLYNSYATGDVTGTGGSEIGGLVGFTSTGTIGNSYATGNVTGDSNVGGLVGAGYGAISNSHATGNVTATGSNVGGLVGNNYGAPISNSYASGNVGGVADVGGLVGQSGGAITTSYATGSVIGSGFMVGGLVGSQYGSVSDSHATGNVTGVRNVGGLVGYDNPQGVVTGSYATGAVSGTFDVGGLVGNNYGGTISGSHATGTITGTTGSSSVGGLVGFNYGSSTITTSYATGSATGDSNVGGLAGSSGGAISSSHATGDISATGNSVGGLVGNNYGAQITNSYASGNVAGVAYVGGLVGQGGGAITNSYATGSVTGNSYMIGGLVGSQYGSISNSHATGDVIGTNNVGGLVGYNDPRGVVSGSFATGAVSGVANVGGLVGNNYGGAISSSHATGTITGITDSRSVGGLVGFNYGTATITLSYASGGVTGENTVGGLAGSNAGTIANSNASGNVSSVNISAGGLVGNNSGGTLGNTYATGTVTGSSEVGGLVGSGSGAIGISEAYGNVTSAGVDAGGLVGIFQSGTISNTIARGSVSGSANVGGLVGDNSGAITSSGAIGAVSAGSGNNAGGLVGIDRGTIDNTFADGAVSGGSSVGGLVGSTTTQGVEPISNSYASGAVSGDSNVGGLVGYNSFAISTSYANGNVSGSGQNVGGLVGTNASIGTISNAFAVGTVAGTGGNVGGLVGTNYGTLTTSYATGSVTSSAAIVGGLVGLNYGTITSSYATGSVSGGNSAVGGLVGSNYGTISKSYAAGSVTGLGANAGGLVGLNYGTILNSYATGNVSGGGELGGLVGSNYGVIVNTYATGSVTGTGSVGGLVGYNGGEVEFSFFNSDIVGVGIGSGAIAGAQGLSTAGLMTMSNFSFGGWDISNTGGSGSVWRIYAGNTAPLLSSFLTPLTVTALNETYVYTGSPVTGLTDASYSVSGAATSGHVFSIGNAYNGATNVGSYGAALYSDQQGYDISYVNAELTITPAMLTVTANGASKIYGQANPALLGSVTGFVGSDTLASATTGSETYSTAATATSSVGTYAITASGLTANNGNYTFFFAAANATAFSITPATLTVSGEGAASRTYDGTTDATLTGGFLSGMVSGDTVTLTQSGHFTSPDVGTGIPVTATDTIVGAGAGNYVLTEPTNIAANITPATLTVSGEVAASRTYDGTTNTTLTGGLLSGMVSGDTVTLTQSGHFTSPDVGTGIPVTATDTLVGAGAANYVLAEPTDLAANITPATLTYTAAAASFTAGQTPSGLTGTLAGFVAGETQLSATTGSLNWTTTAGIGSEPGRYDIDGSGLTAINYVFVNAAANATALTLVTPIAPPSGPTPPSGPSIAALLNAQNAVTSIEATLPSSQTDIQLAMLDVSTIAVTQSVDVDPDVATEPADSIVRDKRTLHDAMVPSLRIVHGGVKLPDDQTNVNVR